MVSFIPNRSKTYSACYISNATKLLNLEEMDFLFRQTALYNETHGITGILLYREGTFIQVLEGKKAAVGLLLHKIQNDSRHDQITFFLRQETGERLFTNYLFGFRGLNENGDLKELFHYLHTRKKMGYGRRLYAFLSPFLADIID